MKKHAILFLLTCLIASGCSSNAPMEVTDEAKTREILDHHWETFLENDLDGVMEDYSEASILITPSGTYMGLEEIRGNFVNAFKAFPTQEATLTLTESKVVQDIGYILWEANTPGFNLSFATDTFIIRDGKIVRQTYAGVREAK